MKMKKLITLWMCLLLGTGFVFVFVDAQGALINCTEAVVLVVSGQGATFPQPIYGEWIFAYSLVRTAVKLTYAGTGSSRGIQSQIDHTNDWGASDIAPTPAQFAAASVKGSELQLFPMVSGAVVPVVNLGAISEDLILDRTTLGRIYAGTIAQWNDAAIAALNPTLSLPNQPILVVSRLDGSGTTEIWTQAMLSFLGPTEWPYGVGPLFNQTLLNLLGARSILTTGSYGVLAQALTTPYTIGYLNYAFPLVAAIPYTRVINRQGNLASAETGVTPAILAANRSSDGTSALIDIDAPDAWPIASLTYLLLDLNITRVPEHRCRAISEVVRWVEWSLSEVAPQERAVASGYTPLPVSTAQAVVASLTALQCNGQPILKYDFIDQRSSAVWIVMLVIAIICSLVPIVLLLAYLAKPERRAFSNIGLWYTLLTLFGSLLLTTAVVLFYLVPTNDAICGLQPWFVGLGFVFLVTPMLSKVCFLLLVSQDSNLYSLVRPLLIILQVILLVIWSAVDLYSSEIILLDKYDLTASYKCDSNDIWIWMGLEIAFYSVILAFGLVLTIISTRSTSTETQCDEIRWIGFTIYNLSVFAAILIPILAALDVSEEIRYFLICLGLIVPAIFIDLALYGQFALEFITKERKDTRSTSSISSRDVI